MFKGLLIAASILWPCMLTAAIYFYYKKRSIALFIPVFTIIVVFLPAYLRFRTLNSGVKAKTLN